MPDTYIAANKCVLVDIEGDIAWVTLNRPEKRNAISPNLSADMQEALESSQAILETGPYAVELTDKMILDLARNNIEQWNQKRKTAGIDGLEVWITESTHSLTMAEDASCVLTFVSKILTKSNDLSTLRWLILAARSENRFQNWVAEAKSSAFGGSGMSMPSAAYSALMVRYDSDGGVSSSTTS